MSKHYVLAPRDEAIVERLVGSGRFPDVEAAVHEGLTLLDQREQETDRAGQALTALWIEGVESGPSKLADDVFDRLEAKYAAMAHDRAR